jgi:hypothetical protein
MAQKLPAPQVSGQGARGKRRLWRAGIPAARARRQEIRAAAKSPPAGGEAELAERGKKAA